MNKTKVVLTDKDIADGNRIIAEFMVPNWKSLMGEDYDGGIDGQDLFTAACLCSEDYTNLRYFESFNSFCLLYTSPSPRDGLLSRMPSSA